MGQSIFYGWEHSLKVGQRSCVCVYIYFLNARLAYLLFCEAARPAQQAFKLPLRATPASRALSYFLVE
jgi:hypothetical protein